MSVALKVISGEAETKYDIRKISNYREMNYIIYLIEEQTFDKLTHKYYSHNLINIIGSIMDDIDRIYGNYNGYINQLNEEIYEVYIDGELLFYIMNRFEYNIMEEVLQQKYSTIKKQAKTVIEEIKKMEEVDNKGYMNSLIDCANN